MEQPWEAIGLVRTTGQHDRFVCTDQLTGWFEGFTLSYQGRGYAVRDAVVFTGWRSTIAGRPLDRAQKAVTDTVFPWGHRVEYPDGSREELLLHVGRRVLSLRLTSPTASPLAIELNEDLDVVEHRTSHSLTVHLIFGESAEEVEANRAWATESVWEAQVRSRWESLTTAWLVTDDESYNKALFWAAASARSLVTNEFGPGIWAGLPWFKDNWGRDTFIALPGTLLCTGAFATARAVLDNFATFQNRDAADPRRGRVPNRVNVHEILYNTADGTPWLIRELDEYLRYTGDRAFARRLRPLIREYVDGALAHDVDAEGLLTHDDADTWMDARIAGREPWSPRGNRAVEIQALWIEALEVGRRLALADNDDAEAAEYERWSLRARAAFERRFVVQGALIDRVDASGRADPRRRPNALLVAWINRTLPDRAVLELTTRVAAKTLITPWGVLSLDPTHPDFHPRHEAPARWHKDAAYHNGTIWGWNAGFAVTALTRCGWQDHAWALTQNLADQILNVGCVGTMSELVDALPDASGRPVPTGTFSQAWSVSEFVRNAYQDYLGWDPDLPQGELRFRPSLPLAWNEVRARLPYADEAVTVHVTQVVNDDGTRTQTWEWEGPLSLPLLVLEVPQSDGSRQRVVLEPTGVRTRWQGTLPPARTDAPGWATVTPGSQGWPVEQGVDVLQARLLKSR